MNINEAPQEPGVSIRDKKTTFCYFCPEAKKVTCEIFDDYTAPNGELYDMKMDKDGYWHLTIDAHLAGKWYGYRVVHKREMDQTNPYKNQVFADPYSRHVTVQNSYDQRARSYILDEEPFDWNDDQHCYPEDVRDLVIYETHLKDLTAHPSSKAKGEGFYNKFVDLKQKGGIAHLKRLGVNCVEFLPLQKFPPVEPPYGEETEEGFFNSWNPYSSNYWGYMTSFFFVPESSFASDYREKYSGYTTASIWEFKNMVKKLHQHDITVLMDVVYNHTSLFDLNPCTHLCPHTYLRMDEKGKLRNRSGTGNEYRSEDPVARQLILDSLRYWVEEYHVDGFRFDLAALLDRDTWDAIRHDLHQIDPRVVFIAEPWGGYYSPAQFSKHGWPSWNDRIRNSIKGSDPHHDKGFIFSEWQHETNRGRLENIMKGTLTDKDGGLYQTSAHSVNYLESHDGYTLADFIRICLDPELMEEKIKDKKAFSRLSDEQMKHAKLAALTLFSAQGIIMIHAGQEFGRAKIIAESDADDPDIGKLDHNSYQKDNPTNWIDFELLSTNKKLFEYYKGLIDLRMQSPALRKAQPKEINFDHFDDPLKLAFYISGKSTNDLYDYYIVLNGAQFDAKTVELPSGSWELLVNESIASSQAINILSGTISTSAKSGMLFRKLRH